MQLIAVEDIGKLVARIFAGREAYLGATVELAGDALTGDELADKIGRAAGAAVRYSRFPASFLAQAPVLAKVAAWVESLEDVGAADIAALRKTHPGLLDFDAWLAKAGARAIRALPPG